MTCKPCRAANRAVKETIDEVVGALERASKARGVKISISRRDIRWELDSMLYVKNQHRLLDSCNSCDYC